MVNQLLPLSATPASRPCGPIREDFNQDRRDLGSPFPSQGLCRPHTFGRNIFAAFGVFSLTEVLP
jgi:hypothetical protein